MLLVNSGLEARADDIQATDTAVVSKSTFNQHKQTNLQTALRKYTGFSLGSKLNSAASTELQICAAKMRYGQQPNSEIAQLFCSNRKTDTAHLIKFWVNFTSPTYGHKAWKINLSLPGDHLSNFRFISELEERFGKPSIVNQPLSYKWTIGEVHLTLIEDQFGIQLELWDRSLHFVT